MWSGPTYQLYYLRVEQSTSDLLAKETADYLRGVDFEEYLNHLVAELEWQPLDWNESGWSADTVTRTAKRYDDFDHRPYTTAEERIRLRVPVSSHPQRNDYLKFGPSTTRGSEPEWEFEGDVLVHEVEASEAAVERGKEDIRFWLGNRNKEIVAGNETLRERVRIVWQAKRNQLEEQHGKAQQVLKSLNIPLHRDPDAAIKPVEIKPRKLRTVVAKPKAKDAPVEPSLQRQDVVDLVTFIEEYARQFEVAPKTYSKMGEEELRDLLLGMLNTNYPGSATGETFRKEGKTDISLRVENGQVLVCECKVWAGANGYSDALDQLFGYLTWRESYGVLIDFCKLKDMSHAVSEAKRIMGEHASFMPGTLADVSETRFISRHKHPQDDEKSLEVHHLFFDLSL